MTKLGLFCKKEHERQSQRFNGDIVRYWWNIHGMLMGYIYIYVYYITNNTCFPMGVAMEI
jgi:hypothetical protein